jgi:hypothetical protein
MIQIATSVYRTLRRFSLPITNETEIDARGASPCGCNRGHPGRASSFPARVYYLSQHLQVN